VPDRLPPLPLGSAALAMICAGLLVMAVSPSVSALITGVLCLALGVTFSTPAFFTAILASAGSGQRGAASGTASAFIDLGLGFGPIALGLVARGEGIPAALGVAAAIAGLGAIWTLGVHRRRPVPPQAADLVH
jgi:predicted MFS family arabinose efflux permease